MPQTPPRAITKVKGQPMSFTADQDSNIHDSETLVLIASYKASGKTHDIESSKRLTEKVGDVEFVASAVEGMKIRYSELSSAFSSIAKSPDAPADPDAEEYAEGCLMERTDLWLAEQLLQKVGTEEQCDEIAKCSKTADADLSGAREQLATCVNGLLFLQRVASTKEAGLELPLWLTASWLQGSEEIEPHQNEIGQDKPADQKEQSHSKPDDANPSQSNASGTTTVDPLPHERGQRLTRLLAIAASMLLVAGAAWFTRDTWMTKPAVALQVDILTSEMLGPDTPPTFQVSVRNPPQGSARIAVLQAKSMQKIYDKDTQITETLESWKYPAEFATITAPTDSGFLIVIICDKKPPGDLFDAISAEDSAERLQAEILERLNENNVNCLGVNVESLDPQKLRQRSIGQDENSSGEIWD